MICAIRFGNNNVGNNFFKNMFSVSNEMTAILVTRFLGNESNNVCVQTFCQFVQKQQREEEEEEEKKVIVKLFALQVNSAKFLVSASLLRKV